MITGSAFASRPLLEGAILLVAVVHLAWIGAIAGTSTAAVAIDALGGPRFRAVSAAIAGAVPAGLLPVAWLEVTGVGLLVLSRLRHPFFPQSAVFWGAVLAALVLGGALLGAYRALLASDRRAPLRVVAGLAGIALLVASAGLLCLGSGALLQPEEWATSEPAWRVLITWSGTGRFGEFTLVSLAGAGTIVAALGERAGATADGRFARRFGYRAALVFLLAWPLALLLTHANLPAIALSPGVWGLGGAGLLLGAAAAWLLTPRLSGEPSAASRALLVLPVAILGTVVGGDQVARTGALQAPILAGLQVPPPVLAPAPAAPPAAAPVGKVAAGKAVFDRVCHLCHRFDVKLIGPPFDSVVPKYRKDPEALKAFIRNPTKKNPAFPQMPKPAVTPAEIDAVAAYLLETAAP